MKESEIIGLTIVTQIGTKSYIIGQTYNGLKLDKIIDSTIDSDVTYVPYYYGITKDKQLVFEAINAPMELEYSTEIKS